MNRKQAIITVSIVAILFVIWIIYEQIKLKAKLAECSIYTVAKVTKIKTVHKGPGIQYTIYLDGKLLVSEDPANPRSFNELLFMQTKDLLGKRFWVQVYCKDYSSHQLLWDIPVPDTLKFVPKEGWNKIPYGLDR